jgi:beta-galactosidase
LAVELQEDNRLFKNSWRLWVFPNSDDLEVDVRRYEDSRSGYYPILDVLKPVKKLESCTASVIVTEILDDSVVDFMRRGGRVLLTAGEGLVFPFDARPPMEEEGHYFFTPAAQFAPFENGHNGTIIHQNPIFNGFPHSGFADYQFYRLMADHPAMDIGSLKLQSIEPIIRVVHKYPVGRSLSYLFEVKIGKGGMLVSSLNLDPSLPEARYLFKNMCLYLKKPEFNPKALIKSNILKKIVKYSQI